MSDDSIKRTIDILLKLKPAEASPKDTLGAYPTDIPQTNNLEASPQSSRAVADSNSEERENLGATSEMLKGTKFSEISSNEASSSAEGMKVYIDETLPDDTFKMVRDYIDKQGRSPVMIIGDSKPVHTTNTGWPYEKKLHERIKELESAIESWKREELINLDAAKEYQARIKELEAALKFNQEFLFSVCTLVNSGAILNSHPFAAVISANEKALGKN